MLLFIIAILFFCFLRRDDFFSVFKLFSLIYIALFYAIPLIFLQGKDGFLYGWAYHYFNDEEYSLAILALIVFLSGFLIADFLRWRFSKENICTHQQSISEVFNAPRFILLLLCAVLLSAYFWWSGVAENSFEGRQGLVEISVFELLFRLIVYNLVIAMVFVSISNGKRSLVVLAFVCLAICAVSLGGRARLLLLLSFLAIYSFKIKLNLLALLGVGAFVVLGPVIFNLKEITYQLIVLKEMPDVWGYYASGFDVSDFFNNATHPLVSMVKVQGIIDEIGYRYFYDYIQGVLFYLRAFGLPISDSLTYFNTENILGVRTSIIPPGYLAFGYVQLGLVGVFVSGIFYYLVGVLCERIYTALQLNNNVAKFYFCVLAASTFYHGEIRVMVLTFIVPLVVIASSVRFCRK